MSSEPYINLDHQAFPAANDGCWASGMDMRTHMSLENLKAIIIAGGRDSDYTDEEKIRGAIAMACELASKLNELKGDA